MTIEYDYKRCPVCGVHYAVDKFLMDHRMKLRDKEWYCPNGHSLVFREYEADRLKRELSSARQQIARVEDERREAEARAEKAEKVAARQMKRASAGLCPCCNRSFSNLRRHMASKHKGVVPLRAAS